MQILPALPKSSLGLISMQKCFVNNLRNFIEIYHVDRLQSGPQFCFIAYNRLVWVEGRKNGIGLFLGSIFGLGRGRPLTIMHKSQKYAKT